MTKQRTPDTPSGQDAPPKLALTPEMSLLEILSAVPAPKPRARSRNDNARALGVHGADRDILDQYLREVAVTPLLTPEQEIAVARRVQAGDEEALQELVKRNLRFVISVAKKYQNRGLALVDLIGEGNLGLMTAGK